MNTVISNVNPSFHSHRDQAIRLHPERASEVESNYFIVQQRELSYQFYLHQHPCVKPLIQRLLRRGTRGLQAADTEYAAGERSLPFGVDVELDTSVTTTLPGATRLRLLEDIDAQLKQGDELALAGNIQVRLIAGTRATLVEELAPTPVPRGKLSPSAAKKSITATDTVIELVAATPVVRFDGTAQTLPAGLQVALASGTELEIPAGAQLQVLRRRMRPSSELYADFFNNAYEPDPSMVRRPYPVKDLDFTSSGAYSVYNWELFYHVPMTIAIHLSKNQRFAEAQRWFHHVFDPTDDSSGPTPERFWKVRPFQCTDVKKVEEILINLTTNADAALRNETVRSIEAWRDAPFRPHVVARYRQQAYMYQTVMAYLDNLISWGDSLFRQDTGEAIDAALMLYVLAANILGPRPLPVPRKGTVRPQTYANLRKDLAQFGTVMRDMEEALPFDLMPFPASGTGDEARLATVRSLGKALYFCVPRNDKLMSYWDTVADRLFKIRNSLNIRGVFRQLALFEPPIDPALLARAAAAGMDVGAIVNGLNQPLPLVRFVFLVQKAAELAQEVKSLGAALLAAMEKEDGEAMALLRAKHERTVMKMVEQVKYGQVQEAIKAREGLVQSLALAVQRYTYYERQLGRQTTEIEIPALQELDQESFNKMKLAAQEPAMALRDIEVDIAQDLGAAGGRIISSHEANELERLEDARGHYDSASSYDMLGSFLSLIPELGAQAEPMGVGAALKFGGMALAKQLAMAASAERVEGDRRNYEANKSAKIGGYARREQDWAFQSNLTAGEINQMFKQLRAAEIRQAVAEQELKSHRQQIKQAEEIERFLNEEGAEKTGKKTHKALYAWVKREVKALYSQCFQLAFDIAKKAERALQHELGKPELSCLQFGYLSGKEGLLAGEKLYLDIRRMEVAYHEQNQREYELTKHVSLLQVDPLALIQLRTTGRCTVRLPESVFDVDGPGHYFRRIKTVAVSIPCVTGPYASINCTLSLLKSSIRKTSAAGEQYARMEAEDPRFSDNFSSLQSIVASSAQNDTGVFETNLRDERYLPFESSGVISEWQLQLPADPSKQDPAQFDYDTISDVLLHIRYTAREGGALLRSAALAHVKQLMADAQAAGSVRLFSVRDEFPAQWARFRGQAPQAGQRFALELELRPEHYPYWSKDRLQAVERVDILARSNAQSVPATLTLADRAARNDTAAKLDTLSKAPSLGDLLVGRLQTMALPPRPVGNVQLFFDERELDDLWLAVSWKGSVQR